MIKLSGFYAMDSTPTIKANFPCANNWLSKIQPNTTNIIIGI